MPRGAFDPAVSPLPPTPSTASRPSSTRPPSPRPPEPLSQPSLMRSQPVPPLSSRRTPRTRTASTRTAGKMDDSAEVEWRRRTGRCGVRVDEGIRGSTEERSGGRSDRTEASLSVRVLQTAVIRDGS